MLKYIEFRASEEEVKVLVSDAFVERETEKIYFMKWQKNRSMKKKVMKAEVNVVFSGTTLAHLIGPPSYKCFCDVDKVNEMIMLMTSKAAERIQDQLSIWGKRHGRLREWNGQYIIQLARRGNAPDMYEVVTEGGTD